MDPAEAAQELHQVRAALTIAKRLVAGLDQVTVALQATQTDPEETSRVRYSGLRTRLDLALVATERVAAYLQARAD